MYFLRLSGYIPENKQVEFEQTYRLVSKQIPGTCEGYSISKDALNEGIYYFISYWRLQSHLQTFSRSAPFLIIKGAFRTLGILSENTSGEMIVSDEIERISLLNNRQAN